MSTILVVDDQPVLREPIAAALRQHGYATLCANNGEEALRIFSSEHPDLVLLDVAMPVMDGLACLRTLRRNPQGKAVPVILLTAVAERGSIVKAANLGIQGYLLKSQFSLDELLARVGQQLAAEESGEVEPGPTVPETGVVPRSVSSSAATESGSAAQAPDETHSAPSLSDLSPVMSKGALREMIGKGMKLKPLGPSVQSVLRATNSSGCSADDVAHAVGKDQALSVRLLKLANSSAYCRGRPVDTIRDAVTRIGVNEVRNLVMSLGIVDRYTGPISEHIDPRLFWEHSMGCGLIASALARAGQRTDVEDSFLWGMLHDAGRLVMIDHAPDEYAAVFDAATSLALPLEVVEQKLMWLDHCAVLAQALEQWKFPRELIAPTVGHHKPIGQIKRAGQAPTNAPGVIALANRIAHALLMGNSGNDTIYPLDDLVELLGLEPSLIQQIAGDLPDETDSLKFSMVAQSNDTAWPDFRSDVQQRLSTPLRALCVSAEPDTDAYRLFCEQIGDRAEAEPPNLGTIFIRDAKLQAELIDEYKGREDAAGGGELPVVLISHKGQIEIDTWLSSRRHVVVKAPVRVTVLVEAINELLG